MTVLVVAVVSVPTVDPVVVPTVPSVVVPFLMATVAWSVDVVRMSFLTNVIRGLGVLV